MNVANFLQECLDNKWDLDDDDIKHILDLDFQYIRDANTIVETHDVEDKPKKYRFTYIDYVWANDETDARRIIKSSYESSEQDNDLVNLLLDPEIDPPALFEQIEDDED